MCARASICMYIYSRIYVYMYIYESSRFGERERTADDFECES